MNTFSAQTEPKNPRYKHYYPVGWWLIDNIWVLLPVFVVGAFLAGLASIHYGLSVMCVWMGLLCFWVDRKHIDYCIFTPLQPMAMVLIMSLGAGISMVVADAPEKYIYGYYAMQMVGLLGCPLFIISYYLVTKNIPGFVFPKKGECRDPLLPKALVLVGWICLLHELGRVIAGVASGTMDRGFAGEFQVENRFGWWSLFGVFPRLQTMGFLLVPLIWRESRIIGKGGVMLVVCTILFGHLVAASRGAVFYPMFTLVVGSFMFLEPKFKFFKYEIIFAVGLVVLFPFVTIMSYYRNTATYQETDIRNPLKKLGGLKDGLKLKSERESDSGENYAEAGRSYIGVADLLVYEMTPNSIPHEGFGRMNDLLWLYVPYMFSQGTRPVIQDGYNIVIQYTGVYMERTSIGISWPADLYRRWSWMGIAIGMPLYGLFYGLVHRWLYTFYMKKNALLGFMFCGILFHFIVAWIYSTVMTNAWYWLYDMPKHFGIVLVIYFAVKTILGVEKVQGMNALVGTDESVVPAGNGEVVHGQPAHRPRFFRLYNVPKGIAGSS